MERIIEGLKILLWIEAIVIACAAVMYTVLTIQKNKLTKKLTDLQLEWIGMASEKMGYGLPSSLKDLEKSVLTWDFRESLGKVSVLCEVIAELTVIEDNMFAEWNNYLQGIYDTIGNLTPTTRDRIFKEKGLFNQKVTTFGAFRETLLLHTIYMVKVKAHQEHLVYEMNQLAQFASAIEAMDNIRKNKKENIMNMFKTVNLEMRSFLNEE